MIANLALVLGLFVVPALLLWLGHRLRQRGPLAFRVFWGAVLGHSAAMLVMLLAALAPPALWDGAGPRAWIVYGALLGGAVVGGLLGGVAGRRRAR